MPRGASAERDKLVNAQYLSEDASVYRLFFHAQCNNDPIITNLWKNAIALAETTRRAVFLALFVLKISLRKKDAYIPLWSL